MSTVRYESKYLVDFSQFKSLSQTLDFLSSDRKAYPVTSLYYDSKYREYYYQKIDGEKIHVKIRLRQYRQTFDWQAPSFLEFKIKNGDLSTKTRHELSSARLFLDQGKWPLLKSPDLFRESSRFALYPSCIISYERKAYELTTPTSSVRITFDSKIKAECMHGLLSKAFDCDSRPNLILMEIKYNEETLPKIIRDLLHQFSIKRVYFSKYALGLNLLLQNAESL